MPHDNWGTARRDVLTDVQLQVGLNEANSTLMAFVQCDGEPYETPYENIQQHLDRSIGPHRIETWKKFFDSYGLLYVDSQVLHITPFGKTFCETWESAKGRVAEANVTLARAAAAILARYQLLNPTTRNQDYPPNCDVLPCRCLWQAITQLDNRLHHEELNRVILKVMRQADIEDAIAKLRAARLSSDYDPNNAQTADTFLGTRVYQAEDQATRRMTPWFSFAGFGGLLISREADEEGFRSIPTEVQQFIDSELSRKATFRDFEDDVTAWFAYLNEPLLIQRGAVPSPSDEQLFQRAIACCRRYGATRFILFSGVAGTGKTRMAGLVADALINGNPERRFETQFHESFSYEDFVEGLSPTASGGFVPTPRIFRLANQKAKEVAASDPSALVVLLIEEFSRANLANVLGELLTYVEHRDRLFRFPLSGHQETVAPNLIIIGTMNPLDRSVVEMDDALIRRARRLHFDYSEDALKEILHANGLPAQVVDRLCQVLRPIRTEIPFGHGVFADVRTEEDLHFLWAEQLQQYFVRPTGERHPAFDTFYQSYPWIDPAFTLLNGNGNIVADAMQTESEGRVS